MNVWVAKRLTPPRTRVLDLVPTVMDPAEVPDVRGCSKCLQCHQPAQWYIWALSPKAGQTNGVIPGWKCNQCKEAFLRQYLKPTWSAGADTVWQAYGLVALDVQMGPA